MHRCLKKLADWYEYHGLYDEAIESALAAKLFDRVSTLIEKFIEIHGLSEMHTLRRWLESFPAKGDFASACDLLYVRAGDPLFTQIALPLLLQAALNHFCAPPKRFGARKRIIHDWGSYSRFAGLLVGGRRIFRRLLNLGIRRWMNFRNTMRCGGGMRCLS